MVPVAEDVAKVLMWIRDGVVELVVGSLIEFPSIVTPTAPHAPILPSPNVKLVTRACVCVVAT